MNGKENVYQFLNNHQISYQYYEHVPFLTVQHAKELNIHFEGTQFLKISNSESGLS